MAILGTTRLKVANGSASVKKLWNGRFRLEFLCEPSSGNADWYHENIGGILPDFAANQSDFFGSGLGEDWSAVPESLYPDMVCVEANYSYIPSLGGKRVQLAYETLTASWVEEKDEDIDYELNGLKRVSRTFVALPDTVYANVIGTTTIISGGTTLYLASFKIEKTDAKWELSEVWVEAGTLSVKTRLMNEGVKETTYTYLINEGTVIGDVISRDIGNFEGLQTITVSVLTSRDGTTLTDGGVAKLNYEYQQLVPFTFPGVVDLIRLQNHIFPAVRSPVEAKVKADVLIYYQSSPTIEDSDYLLDLAIGIWNPSEWCQKISTIDSFVSDTGAVQPAYFNAQGIRGCRTRSSITVNGDSGVELRGYQEQITPENLRLEETTDTENGKSVYRQVFDYSYDVTRTYFRNSSGVQTFRGPFQVKGTYTVEMKWTGSQWQITYADVIIDRTRTDAVSGDLNFTYSIRAGDWLGTYSNVSASTSGTLLTATGGGAEPSDATWIGITVDASSNKESLAALSLPANSGFGISQTGFWIEGRNVDNGASGKITISGGPDNPLGKRYVLDVSLKKAFEDINGNITWMKQVVVANVNPVT